MFHILSVDDQAANQKLIKHALSKEFNVQLADNGKEALQAIAECRPDLILLDVYMPLMDGLETCRRVREIAGTDELPVIFISALSTLNDKLNGYEAGANDYIAKPIQIPELISKINVLLEQQHKSNASLNTTQQAISSAINHAGELGTVIQFFEQSFACETLEDLAKAVFKANAQLGLSTSLQFRGHGDEYNFASRGLISPVEAELLLTPLETELLSQARQGGRIITYGNKSLYNSDSVTILVKNLPFEDSQACARIRDHLAIILRACEAQVELIVSRTQLQKFSSDRIDRLSRKMAINFQSLNETLAHYQQQSLDSLDNFRIDFKEAVTMSDMPKDQFDSLMASLNRLYERNKNSQYQKETMTDLIADLETDLHAIKQS